MAVNEPLRPAIGGPAMRMTFFISVALVASACGPKTGVVMLDPAAPRHAPVSPDSVLMFYSAESVLLQYEPIARLSTEGRSTGDWAPGSSSVVRALREKAAELGGDAIILGEIRGQYWADSEREPAYGNATAIRLGEAGSKQRMEAASVLSQR